jgi:23S rRNA (guanosine2251-2'-O)-methyltransferase
MVERSRRGKGKHKRQEKLLGSHARSWLWGRNLVRETLAAGRWPILELHLADNLPSEQLAEARTAAERLGLVAAVENQEVLERLAHTAEHQGYLAKMGPFPYRTVDELLSAAPSNPLYLILDAIQDPYNFGAMLRSAAAFAVNAVFIGTDRQVPVTSMVARSSAGALNHVPIAQVVDLPELTRTLRDREVHVIGTSEKADQLLTACNFRDATAIVVGNEGTGISPALLACCDSLARIPIEVPVGSLNAAAAAAVFFFEVRRQRASTVPGGARPS